MAAYFNEDDLTMHTVANSLVALLSIVLLTHNSSAQVIVAHRGASYDAPENTMAAFNLAWRLGADAIEGDFHLTSDGQIVCHHDLTTERLSGQKLEVASSTLKQLSTLDVGAWKHEKFRGERVTTLPAVLKSVPEGKVLYIEVKCGPEIVPVLKQTIIKARIKPKQIRVIAFNEEVIRAAKLAMPDYEAYWLVSPERQEDTGNWSPSGEQIIGTALDCQADGVDINGKLDFDYEALFSACRDAGLSTHVWTIDKPQLAKRFARWGVDSVTTNRPDFIRKSLSVKKAAELSPRSTVESLASRR